MHHWAYVHSRPRFFGSSLFIIVFSLLAASQRVQGAATGLNNIPTTDTAPNLTLVLQEYSTSGAEQKPNHIAGFKFGLDPWKEQEWVNRFEMGLDSHFAPGDAGPAVFDVKYATQPRPNWPALGLGAANLAVTSEGRQRAGQPFSYGVLSQDLKWLRLHAGYGLQTHNNNTVLLGAVRTFKLFNRDLMLRADALQTEHQHNWAASIGGLYSFCNYFALESWMTQPINDAPPSFTVKLDFVIAF